MPLLLPNLDDRKWAELVDQGRALIPVYGPEWTDHNASDPGITLIELLAWIAEMDIYELNQISDRERLKFLKLVDVVPRGPQPADAAMRITLDNGAPLSLPAGVEFRAMMPRRLSTRFRTCHAITLAPGTLEALQFKIANCVSGPDARMAAAHHYEPIRSRSTAGDGILSSDSRQRFLSIRAWSSSLLLRMTAPHAATAVVLCRKCFHRERLPSATESMRSRRAETRRHERDAEEIPAPETCGSLNTMACERSGSF